MSTIFSTEKAERLSRLRIWYMLQKRVPNRDPIVDDVGFLIECLAEAEKAAANQRAMCSKIRDSRDILVANLEQRLAEALEPETSHLESVDIRDDEGYLQARIKCDAQFSEPLLTALEQVVRGMKVTRVKPS